MRLAVKNIQTSLIFLARLSLSLQPNLIDLLLMATHEVSALQGKIGECMVLLHDVFCKHGLRYYLIGGSMLGAVRHKGFIPWDDDIDIAMPRRDYELLRKNCKEWLPEYMEFVDHEVDDEYRPHFAKVQDARTTLVEQGTQNYVGGVYIDIFPFDGVPSGSISRWWHIKRFDFWHRINYFLYRDPYKHGKGPSSWLPRMVQALFSRKKVHKKLDRIMTECDFETSAYVSHHNNQSPTHFFKKEVIGEPKLYDFADTRFYGVAMPDCYLTEYYGATYMQLPPEAKRIQHRHHYLNLRLPYRSYSKKKE